jgi:hypothetical protein
VTGGAGEQEKGEQVRGEQEKGKETSRQRAALAFLPSLSVVPSFTFLLSPDLLFQRKSVDTRPAFS